jgi:cytochrome c peroxidase
MNKIKIIVVLMAFFLFGFVKFIDTKQEYISIQDLRKMYSSGDAKNWPKAILDKTVDTANFVDIGVLPKIVFPQNNLYTKEKADLGKMLFFDPRLSSSGQISCANCHNPELGWTDNLTRSFGHDRQTGARNAMTILNVGYATSFFWDGRAGSIEAQSVMPIQDQLEMNEHLNLAVKKINKLKGYQILFSKAFEDKAVSQENIQKAIATFERTITSPPSRFDKFISGKSEVFTDEEVQGMHIFRTKANCISCHNTPYFSDNQFHNDGQILFGTKNEDFGRYNVTKQKADLGKFRTPTLREVVRTGPWMHHGHFPSLLDVVELYNLGNPSPVQARYKGTPRDSLQGKTSPILRKLALSKQEVKALISFVETLSTPNQRMKMPELPKE